MATPLIYGPQWMLTKLKKRNRTCLAVSRMSSHVRLARLFDNTYHLQAERCRNTFQSCWTHTGLTRRILEIWQSMRKTSLFLSGVSTKQRTFLCIFLSSTSFFVELNLTQHDSKRRIRGFQSAVKTKRAIGTYKLVYYSTLMNSLWPACMLSNVGQRNLLNAYAITDIPFTVGKELSLRGRQVSAIYTTVGLQGVPFCKYSICKT